MTFDGSEPVAGVAAVLLLVSFFGWGALIAWGLGLSRRRVGVGLMAGWGMAFVLGVGGVLQLLRVANELTLIPLMGMGFIGLYMRAIFANYRRWRWRNPGPYLPVIILCVVCFGLSVKAAYFNHWDDYPAYLVFVKDFLQTGVIDQPFSLRRLLTFGGQQQLQAMALIRGTVENADMLEQGVCRVMLVLLVAGAVRPRGVRQRWVAGMFLACLLFVPREHLPIENTHSEMTGLVLFLTLLRTLSLAGGRPVRLFGIAALAGLVGAAASSMRVSHLPAAVFMISFYYVARMVFDRRHAWMHAGQFAVAGGVFALALLPWSVVLYQTSGTLLNPLWLGNQQAEYNYLSSNLSVVQKFVWVTGFALRPMNDGTPLGLVMCLPLLLALRRRHWRVELPVALAAVVTAVMILMTFTFAWYDTIYRYIFPIMCGVSVSLLYQAMMRPPELRQGGRLAGVVLLFMKPANAGRVFVWVAAALMFVFYVPLGAVWMFYGRRYVPEPDEGVPRWRIAVEEMEAAGGAYYAAQRTIAAGERVLVGVSFPTHFDFARNKILIVDVPGAASPAVGEFAGMPLFEGPEAVKRYLLALNIRHIVYSEGDGIQNMYSREFWYGVRDNPEKATGDIRNVLRFYLAWFEVLDGLKRSEKVLHEKDSLVVLQLQ